MRRRMVLLLALTPVGIGALWTPSARAQAPGPKQVLDITEMMDQLFRASYTELTRAVASKPANRQAWRAIFDPARRLAEVTNLLFSTGDKEYMKKPEWATLTDASRNALVEIAEVVRKQNYELARKRYEAAVASCNACHEKFEPEAPVVKAYEAEIK